MNRSIGTSKTLIIDFLLFLGFGVIAIAITIIGMSAFPGNNLFPVLMRLIIILFILVVSFYVNYKLSRKNLLNYEILHFKTSLIKYYLGGIVLGCLLIATIWTIVYFVYPFEIVKNVHSKSDLVPDLVITYVLGNTLEELLFRGFLLLASIKLFGRIGGVILVSLLFGLFHLQGAGLSMVVTTFTMSLLFIAVIFYTGSIWTAVTFHITGNFLLHTLGFDGASNGMFQIKILASNYNGLFITLILEIVVISFALVIYLGSKKRIKMT